MILNRLQFIRDPKEDTNTTENRMGGSKYIISSKVLP